jgi:hypothetical protein
LLRKSNKGISWRKNGEVLFDSPKRAVVPPEEEAEEEKEKEEK